MENRQTGEIPAEDNAKLFTGDDLVPCRKLNPEDTGKLITGDDLVPRLVSIFH